MTHIDQGLIHTGVKQIWVCLDFQSGAVFSAVVVKGGDPYALAVALEAIKVTGGLG